MVREASNIESEKSDDITSTGKAGTALSALALGLVLSAAIVHASWNLLAKKAGGGAAFVWLFSAMATVVYAPVALAVLLLQSPSLGLVEIACMLGSAALHVGYFLFLQRGYRAGDLSLVYPVARGTGPLLATGLAILLLGERPTALVLAGALFVVAGVYVLSSDGRFNRKLLCEPAVGYGLLTGVFIASYTVLDKYAVGSLQIPPILLDFGSNLGRTVMLMPVFLRGTSDVRAQWRSNRWYALGVACLSPLSYILILTAMSFTDVSYIAPAREISILFGAVLSTRFLGERQSLRRLLAAGAIVLGVVALAYG